jgi:hypothetical protein
LVWVLRTVLNNLSGSQIFKKKIKLRKPFMVSELGKNKIQLVFS